MALRRLYQLIEIPFLKIQDSQGTWCPVHISDPVFAILFFGTIGIAYAAVHERAKKSQEAKIYLPFTFSSKNTYV